MTHEIRNLAGRSVKDGIEFECDDCHGRFFMSTVVTDGHKLLSDPELAKPWTLTKRKQRCPSCSEVARAKGWVQ